MKGRTLTEATEMLQNAEDLITLKIARPIEANSKVYKVITYIASVLLILLWFTYN